MHSNLHMHGVEVVALCHSGAGSVVVFFLPLLDTQMVLLHDFSLDTTIVSLFLSVLQGFTHEFLESFIFKTFWQDN
jgi:hypothetical protein